MILPIHPQQATYASLSVRVTLNRAGAEKDEHRTNNRKERNNRDKRGTDAPTHTQEEDEKKGSE